MSIEIALNYIPVDDRIATCGQPDVNQFIDAQANGFQVVIDLAPTDPLYSIDDEAGLVRSLGMEYHHIPVAWTNPTLDDYEAFRHCLDERRSRKILIHCAANYRVSAFYATYAMERGIWDEETADAYIARIWEKDPKYPLNAIWKNFLLTARAQIRKARGE